MKIYPANKNYISFLILSVFTVYYSSTASAQDKFGILRAEKTNSSIGTRQPQAPTTDTRIRGDFGKGINFSGPGHMATNKSEIFDRLLNYSGNSPSWPSFPRVWHEESVLSTIETSTYWLPRLKVINGGIEADYKYGVKTTLVMMASLHKQGASPEGEQKEIADEAYQLIKPDPETKRVYPNHREGYPMVGFCSYELQLSLSKGQSFGFEAFNAGIRVKHTSMRNVTHTVFSKFFEIPKNLPIQGIFNYYCNDTFARHVRPLAEENFVPVVVEELFYHSPHNQCHPSPKDSEKGDVACMEWFEGFDRLRKHISVPRCVTTKDGFNVCRLRAKENNRCPIYINKKGEQRTDVTEFGLREFTKSKFAYPCDKGLTCEVTKPPSKALGFIPLLGESFCRK